MSQYQQSPYHPDMGYGNLPPQDQESLGSWVLLTFLMFIPLVNVIYLLVLAFGGGSSRAKTNFARASLIWWGVGVVLSIIGLVLFASFGLTIYEDLLNSTYSLLAAV